MDSSGFPDVVCSMVYFLGVMENINKSKIESNLLLNNQGGFFKKKAPPTCR